MPTLLATLLTTSLYIFAFFACVFVILNLWSIFFHYTQPKHRQQTRDVLATLRSKLDQMKRFPFLSLFTGLFVFTACAAMKKIAEILGTPTLAPHPAISKMLGDLSGAIDQKLQAELIQSAEFWELVLRNTDSLNRHPLSKHLPTKLQACINFAQRMATYIDHDNNTRQIAKMIAHMMNQRHHRGQDYILAAHYVGMTEAWYRKHADDVNAYTTNFISEQLRDFLAPKKPLDPEPAETLSSPAVGRSPNPKLIADPLSDTEDQLIDMVDVIATTSWHACLKSGKNLVAGFVTSLGDYARKALSNAKDALGIKTWIDLPKDIMHLAQSTPETDSLLEKICACKSRPSFWRKLLPKARQLNARLNWIQDSTLCHAINKSLELTFGTDIITMISRSIGLQISKHCTEMSPSDQNTLAQTNFAELVSLLMHIVSDEHLTDDDYACIANVLALVATDPGEDNDLPNIDIEQCLQTLKKIMNASTIQALSEAQIALLNHTCALALKSFENEGSRRPITLQQAHKLAQCLKTTLIDDKLVDTCLEVTKTKHSAAEKKLAPIMYLLGKTHTILKDNQDTLGACIDAYMRKRLLPASKDQETAFCPSR